MRGALREDPDIILVGEMRDLETIELAITAAATGHLVFGTLHTQSAAVPEGGCFFPASFFTGVSPTMRIAREERLDALGRGPGGLLSFGAYHGPDGALFAAGAQWRGEAEPMAAQAIRESVASAWFAPGGADPIEAETTPDALKADAYSWAKAPRHHGRPMEVGAIARQAIAGHPLIADIVARDGGSSVRGRVVARLLEVAILTHVVGGWIRELRLKEAFCLPYAAPAEGRAAGLVEAARGALGHWLVVRDGQIQRYQIIAPTTWNFSPRDDDGAPGPLESALAGLEVGERGAKAAAIQHVVRSFDPCMVCTAH